jgi:hypothetical protein
MKRFHNIRGVHFLPKHNGLFQIILTSLYIAMGSFQRQIEDTSYNFPLEATTTLTVMGLALH